MCVMSAMGAMCDKRFISEVSDIVYSIGLILHVLPVAKYEHTIDSSIDAVTTLLTYCSCTKSQSLMMDRRAIIVQYVSYQIPDSVRYELLHNATRYLHTRVRATETRGPRLKPATLPVDCKR